MGCRPLDQRRQAPVGTGTPKPRDRQHDGKQRHRDDGVFDRRLGRFLAQDVCISRPLL